MKLVSWNINGLRSAWNHGLISFLETSNADIYAFQETKINKVFSELKLHGYESYWSFCSKKGYSGTLCLTKHKPLNIFYDMGNPDFDTEGRIITLEFENFFFINVYVPNSQHSQARKDYRNLWDEYMRKYFMQLDMQKPVIATGDFNVPISDSDIYAENRWIELNKDGFQSTERENLLALIDNDFVDSYRMLHPQEFKQYTWWSNRGFKRKNNQGWRLDYFFVSKRICDRIQESTMCNNIMGSDHCPIVLDISLLPSQFRLKSRTSRKIYTHNDLLQFEDCNISLSDFKKTNLTQLWKSINWEIAENHLAQMQSTLAKVAYSRNLSLIEKWQNKITNAINSKLLAVRQVCGNGGAAGIDNIRWTTAYDKMFAALSLTSRDYRAMPSKLFLLKSKNNKSRYIRVETYYDKAIQCLYSYALAPVAESWADKKSFAFRKGRSAFDVNEYIKRHLSGPNAPEWIFIGDVRKCYDSISHKWILEHIPLSKHILYEFLKAGYILHGELFPTDVGIGLGSSISPIIANMVIDGLQDYVYKHLHGENIEFADISDGNLIRYADDIIFTARSYESATRIKKYVSEFLAKRGLELSDKKSKITNISMGFSFMSRTYVKCGENVIATPSNTALGKFMTVMRETITNFKGSQKTLIEQLNRKIDGWLTYHKVSHAETAFRKMDVYIRALLLQLCKQKHPNPKWTHEKLLQKYWYIDDEGRHRYALPNKKEFYVKFLADTLLVDYSPVRTNSNAYIDLEYFEHRLNEREILNVTGVYRSIWERQNGCCYYCGRKILRDEKKVLIETNPDHYKFTSRMSYIHEKCQYNSFELVDVETIPTSLDEILKLLKRLDDRKEFMGSAFFALFEFFRDCSQKSVTLKFSQIEKIMNKKLPEQALQKEFWYCQELSSISQCWKNNEYEIHAIHLEEPRQRITFRRISKNKDIINIPEVIRIGKIPQKAKYELENYFTYILKKYGL